MTYRDGWKLIPRFGYWVIFDGNGRYRGRRTNRMEAYEEMYRLIGSNY